MSVNTSIEWTDTTWNPIRGCTRVSEGCRNCYAEKVAYRFSGEGLPYSGLAVLKNGHPSWTGKVEFVEKHLLDPLKWKRVLEDCNMCGAGPDDTCMHGSRVSPYSSRWRSRRIFVNSMSDLFHENVTDEMRDKIFAVMALCPQHTFQVLTKRPIVAWDYWFTISTQHRLFWISQAIDDLFPQRTPETIAAKERLFEGGPLPNVLHGFSAENQETFDSRWDVMGRLAACQFPTFASLEPLLGPIDMGKGRLPGWVICGGESGPGARPMHPDWARSLRDQCAAANVPFFFKQWGEWAPTNDPEIAKARGIRLEDCMSHVGKKAAGALLDGVEHKAFPEGK
jgi:protein gp37